MADGLETLRPRSAAEGCRACCVTRSICDLLARDTVPHAARSWALQLLGDIEDQLERSQQQRPRHDHAGRATDTEPETDTDDR